MAEVVGMKNKKKYIIGSLVVIFCLFIPMSILYKNHQEELKLEAKNKEKVEQMENDILNSVQCHGFPNAYMDTYTNNIYINNGGEENIAVWQSDIEILDLEKNSDIASILDAVVPVFDKKFESGDGKTIVNRLIQERRYDESEDEFSAGSTSFHHIRYKEYLDDTGTYADKIYIEYKLNTIK